MPQAGNQWGSGTHMRNNVPTQIARHFVDGSRKLEMGCRVASAVHGFSACHREKMVAPNQASIAEALEPGSPLCSARSPVETHPRTNSTSSRYGEDWRHRSRELAKDSPRRSAKIAGVAAHHRAVCNGGIPVFFRCRRPSAAVPLGS
jgi:hypothetical protein